MASTPQRTLSEVSKSPGQFSPVTVQESPVSKTAQRGNLTGHPRVIRDHAADAYNLIQKWNTHQILGGRIIKNIVTLKTSAMSDGTLDTSQVYPTGLQEHCDQLGEVCAIMKEVSSTLKLIHKQVEAIVKLEKLKGTDRTPMFISWPAEKFGEVLLDVSEAYEEELKVKLCVQQNVAHTRCKATLMLHAAAWAHQPYITPRMDLAMESLLQETGHR
ncbi:hypothetical protein R5R35_005330 [Gryllus longicercus]|uniref:Cyclin-dependent kinase 2-interacting protein n=1 Tax=Gryllus longicercus TaxID=2509291 RepID=A0AAN9VHP1_9ORTH